MGYCVWSEKCSCQVASQFRLSRTRTREYASAHLRLPTQLSCSTSGVMNHDIKQTSGSNLHPLFPRDERQSSKSMVRTPLMVRIHSYVIITFFHLVISRLAFFSSYWEHLCHVEMMEATNMTPLETRLSLTNMTPLGIRLFPTNTMPVETRDFLTNMTPQVKRDIPKRIVNNVVMKYFLGDKALPYEKDSNGW